MLYTLKDQTTSFPSSQQGNYPAKTGRLLKAAARFWFQCPTKKRPQDEKVDRSYHLFIRKRPTLQKLSNCLTSCLKTAQYNQKTTNLSSWKTQRLIRKRIIRRRSNTPFIRLKSVQPIDTRFLSSCSRSIKSLPTNLPLSLNLIWTAVTKTARVLLSLNRILPLKSAYSLNRIKRQSPFWITRSRLNRPIVI